jgi:hypothetical protein
MNCVRSFLALSIVGCVALSSQAAQPWALFGDAQFVREGGKGNKWVVELSSIDDSFSGVSFSPRKNTTFADLRELSASYNVVEGRFGGGSPRFQVALDNDGDGDSDGNVFVYLGTPPNFDDEPSGWESTGNLLLSEDLRFDLTQFGGPFYGSYEDALELVGDAEVVSVNLVVDAGWLTDQVILFDDIRVDNFKLNGQGAAKK